MDLKDLLQLSPKELEKVLRPVIAAANRDQKALVDKYMKTHSKKSKIDTLR